MDGQSSLIKFIFFMQLYSLILILEYNLTCRNLANQIYIIIRLESVIMCVCVCVCVSFLLVLAEAFGHGGTLIQTV